MNMTQQSTSINLYIHPDNGPVVMLELDMLDIELSIIHTDVNSNRDNARVDRIIEYIRSQYPQVRPEANRDQLRVFISRLATLSIYDGIVLRLPGTIQGNAPTSTGYTAEDINQLTNEITRLRGKLQEAELKRDENAVLAEALRRQHDGIRKAHEDSLKQMNKVREELKEAEEEESKAFKEVKQLHMRVNLLEQEKAELTTELEKEKRERAAMAASLQELARLRQQASDAKDTERSLRDTLKKKEQAVESLQQEVRELSVELGKAKVSSGKPDQVKGPYLD